MTFIPHPGVHPFFETLAYAVGYAVYRRSRNRTGDFLPDDRRWLIIAAASSLWREQRREPVHMLPVADALGLPHQVCRRILRFRLILFVRRLFKSLRDNMPRLRLSNRLQSLQSISKRSAGREITKIALPLSFSPPPKAALDIQRADQPNKTQPQKSNGVSSITRSNKSPRKTKQCRSDSLSRQALQSGFS